MQWIQTYTGRRFFPLQPRVEDIDVRDIAHALSLQCRFNGHCQRFYCVAEHCVRVSRRLATREEALWGLLHDAAEAYLTDLPRPVKKQMPLFIELEDRLLRVIVESYGLPWPMPATVARADDELLATEARDVMGPAAGDWNLGIGPMAEVIVPMAPEEAEAGFLKRFEELRA